ncbi:cyclic nucleotide-binding domain-containing protein [bacterium]|nr:cyclic nucleotide-binding domain-containing protein [bacterium]
MSKRQKSSFNENLVLIRRIEVFTKLPESLLRKVARKMEKVRFNSGEEIQAENQPWKALYVITEGTVEVFMDGSLVAERNAGDTIGELALVDDDPFRISLIAKTPVTACMLKRQDFRRLMKTFWANTWNFLQLVVKRVKHVVEVQIQDKHERQRKVETLKNYFLGRVMMLEAERDTLREVLDRLPTGVVLLDQNKKIILANKSAQTIVDQRSGLLIKQNEVHASNPLDNRKLQELIGKASNLKYTLEESGGAVMVSRKSQTHSMPILISPLRSKEYSYENRRAAAALFISDPDLAIPGPQEILRKLYGLTPTEARLSSALLQGKNVMQVARELHIKVNTVRSHLKSIFLKTGANRQSELVRILITSPRLAS